jgi:hypothetical protein
VSALGTLPKDATAVVLNLTAVGSSSAGNLRVYPGWGVGTPPAPPNASWINYIPGRDVPNQVVVPLVPGGVIHLYSDAAPGGSVHVAADLIGVVRSR